MLSIFERAIRRRRRTPESLIRPWSVRRSLIRLALLLVALAALHVLAIVAFEGLTAFQVLWLTMTTMTTMGYGDYSAETVPGRLATMLLVFLGGIWVAFQSAASCFEYRAERRERMRQGRWRWNMRDHILLLNVPSANAAAYLFQLVRELRASRRFSPRPVQIVCGSFENGLPERLAEMGVVHHHGQAWDPAALRAAGAAEAEIIVVLAQSDADPATDGRTLDIVDRLRELGGPRAGSWPSAWTTRTAPGSSASGRTSSCGRCGATRR